MTDNLRKHPLFTLLKTKFGWTDEECDQFLRDMTEYMTANPETDR